MMKKRFIKIKDKQIHIRYTGKGSPIVLFHASPGSSKTMIPLMKELSLRFLVIAVDLPGYGLSDPLPEEEPEIEDYVQAFKQCFDQLGLSRFAIYGTAAGAQIAIRYALRYPDHIAQIYLAHVAHFTEEQRRDIFRDYFPDLSPRYDGSHLKKMWKMIRNSFVYFPWSDPQPQNQLNTPFPSTAILDRMAQDYLQSGSDYDKAGRAAFMHEQARHVQQLKIPATIFHWESSMVKPYTEQLLAFELPEHIRAFPIAADGEKRNRKMSIHIAQTYTEDINYNVPSQKLETFGQAYLPAPGGVLHAFVDLRSEGTPLIIFHDWRSSAAVAHLAFKELGIERPFIAISLPGHGDSDHLMEAYIETKVAKAVITAIARIGIEDYEVAGLGRGMSIAQQMQLQKGVLVEDLFGAQQEAAHLPKLLADEYGQYLSKAWKHLQKYSTAISTEEGEESYLGDLFNSMQADELQLQLREWLKCRY